MRRRVRVFSLVSAALVGVLAGVIWLRSGAPPVAPQHRISPNQVPEGPVLRVGIFGTSLSAAALWPERLQALCPLREVEIVRIAAPGEGSDWALANLADLVGGRPDLVFMEFAINDADLLDGLGLARSADNHRRLVAALVEALPGVPVYLMTTSPAFGPRGWVRPRLGHYYAMLRGVAAEAQAGAGVGLIDLEPLWHRALAGATDRRAFLPDGLHPDPEREAALILPVLDQEIFAAVSGCR